MSLQSLSNLRVVIDRQCHLRGTPSLRFLILSFILYLARSKETSIYTNKNSSLTLHPLYHSLYKTSWSKQRSFCSLWRARPLAVDSRPEELVLRLLGVLLLPLLLPRVCTPSLSVPARLLPLTPRRAGLRLVLLSLRRLSLTPRPTLRRLALVRSKFD